MTPSLQVGVGLILLLGGAEVLVRGSAALAAKLNVPPMVIGLTVVAFGTSAPELVVCINAALTDAPGIALGNVVGSNIANVLLILGMAAVIRPLPGIGVSLPRDFLPLLVITLILTAMVVAGTVERWMGVVLVGLLFGFLYASYRRGTAGEATEASDLLQSTQVKGLRSLPSAVILAIAAIGLVGVLAGADQLVAGATTIARDWGVPEEVIGLTMVAFGTSIPELVTSILAGLRGHSEVALGNVIGSNIWNILAVLGLTASIAPIPVAQGFIDFDIWVNLIVTLALLPLVVGANRRLGRVLGVVFVSAYLTYVWVQFGGMLA